MWLMHYCRTRAASIQPSEFSNATASIVVDAQDQDFADEVHSAPMSAEDKGVWGVGGSYKEMEPKGEDENQVRKEKTLRSTRAGRITAESDVVGTADVLKPSGTKVSTIKLKCHRYSSNKALQKKVVDDIVPVSWPAKQKVHVFSLNINYRQTYNCIH